VHPAARAPSRPAGEDRPRATTRLYDCDSIYEFLKMFEQVSSTPIDREDFARAAFESIKDG
jgi:hypothetical protein